MPYFLNPNTNVVYDAEFPLSGYDIGVTTTPPSDAHRYDTELCQWYLPEPPFEEVKNKLLEQLDEETEAAILAGFDYQPEGYAVPLHFSYNLIDQQNFADAANAATLAKLGVPGVPSSVEWNAYMSVTDETGTVHTERKVLNLSPDSFLALYMGGALVHKATCWEVGRRKVAAVKRCVTKEELEEVMASW